MDKTQVKNKTSTKLFLGCLLTSELKMHLNSSSDWQNAKMEPQESCVLKEVLYENKKFIGFYLEEEKLTLKTLKEHECKLRTIIESFCHSLDSSKLKCSVFSQFFIS
jgi:hypothetical protein